VFPLTFGAASVKYEKRFYDYQYNFLAKGKSLQTLLIIIRFFMISGLKILLKVEFWTPGTNSWASTCQLSHSPLYAK
jgi:hypothetical protein